MKKQCECAACSFEVLEFPSVLPFSEAEELALAMELLEVANEEELEQFLGKVFKKIGKFAKKALPFVGKALGSFIPIPGVGTAIGGALGTLASKAIKGEQELEEARQFVRLTGTAALNLLAEPVDAVERNPAYAVDRAVGDAVRVVYPHGRRRARQAARAGGRWRRAGGRLEVEL
jgi:hypothetical protein